MTVQFVPLPRDLVEAIGSDRRTFLQGLISQDTEKVTPDKAAYGTLLTPQGKYLHDFILTETGDRLLLDCEAGRGEDLITRLSRFKLRADVTLSARPELSVTAVFGDGAFELLELDASPGATRHRDGLIMLTDPRLAALGARIVGARETAAAYLRDRGAEAAGFEDYDQRRIALQVPDGSRDLEIEKSTLLESNIDDLNGIDWDKGCYMGQELTARTKYRGLVKRRLVAFVAKDGGAIAPGTEIKNGDKTVGEVRSVSGDHLLASVRLEALAADSPPVTAADAELHLLSGKS